MSKRICLLFTLVLSVIHSSAQQFIGFSGNSQFAQVSNVPLNPSFVVKPENGIELNVFSGSAVFGTNAYNFSKEWFTGGLSRDSTISDTYSRDLRKKNKHLWGNVDIIGPGVSFTLKEHHFGVYTRVRQIARGGNVSFDGFQFIGPTSDLVNFPDTVSFKEAGFTAHTFGELGFSYGRQLGSDFERVFKIGFTVKYLAGIAAGTLYTPNIDQIKNNDDSTNLLKGDLTALYSENFNAYIDNDASNDMGSWFNRGGKGGLGFDIGMQYEYHPGAQLGYDKPYTFRIAASITDIGSIAYRADTGSGQYKVNIVQKADWQFERRPFEDFASYFGRLKRDTLLKQTDSSKTFRVGLPTAFRINTDFNLSSNFWVSSSIVLNMRGNAGGIYKPGYVNMLNITPRYENDWFMVGLPVTFLGYQTISMGVVLRAGPFYIGSSSIVSTAVRKELNNFDAFAGLSLRFPKERQSYL
jgi:hypothetical protein